MLATQHDPFRVDTPARRRDGEWLAVRAERLGLGMQTIHLHGLHYMLVSGEAAKPDGTPYTNADDDWAWLQEDCAKGALARLHAVRADRRRPQQRAHSDRARTPAVVQLRHRRVDVEIPNVDELEPCVGIDGFTREQPFKLVLFGEKTSLQDVLGRIARAHEADLYLPTA